MLLVKYKEAVISDSLRHEAIRWNSAYYSLGECGVDDVRGQDVGQAEQRQEFDAPVLEQPVDKALVSRIDGILKDHHDCLGQIGDRSLLSMHFALRALGIEIGGKIDVAAGLRYKQRRLHGQTAIAIDEVVTVEESQGVVEALLAHIAQNDGVGREENPGEAIHVLSRELDAGVGEVHVEQLGGKISRADIALAAEGRDGDGVLVEGGQVVAESTIHVANAVESRRQ